MSGPAAVERLRAALAAGEAPGRVSGFHETMGFTLDHDERHGVIVRCTVDGRHLNQFEVAHGGLAASMLDTIGGVTCWFALTGLARVATISLTTNFLRAAQSGPVLATGRLDQAGNSTAYVAMELRAHDLDGPLLATGTGAFRLFRER